MSVGYVGDLSRCRGLSGLDETIQVVYRASLCGKGPGGNIAGKNHSLISILTLVIRAVDVKCENATVSHFKSPVQSKSQRKWVKPIA